MFSNRLDHKASSFLIMDHFVDINTITLWVHGIFSPAFAFFLCKCMHSQLGMVWLPVNCSKFDYLAVNLDLLMRDKVIICQIEYIHSILCVLLDLVFINHGQVGALWMERQPETERPLHWNSGQEITIGYLHEANPWIWGSRLGFLLFVSGLVKILCVYEEVARRGPFPLVDAVDVDRGSSATSILKCVHRR